MDNASTGTHLAIARGALATLDLSPLAGLTLAALAGRLAARALAFTAVLRAFNNRSLRAYRTVQYLHPLELSFRLILKTATYRATLRRSRLGQCHRLGIRLGSLHLMRSASIRQAHPVNESIWLSSCRRW